MASGGLAVMMTGSFGEPEKTIALPRPMTIAEVIAANDLHFRLPTIAVMGDKPVLRGEWNVRVVRETDVIAFVSVPAGGGGNNSGKQIVGLIAALALSIAAPMIGGWAAGALGFGAGTMGFTIASNLVAGLVLLGGSLLLNMLYQPPKNATTANDQADPVYTANAASNQSTPFDPVPVLYGKLRFPPRFASRPYAEFAGNDQYLYQLFCVTLGKADITKIEIGETEAWNSVTGYSPSFSDLEFQIVQPGDDVTLFPANVLTSVEVASQTVPNPPDILGPFVINPAGTQINRIAVDFIFPGGLFEYDDAGAIKAHSVGLRAQYRAIDASGSPIGSWTDVFNQTITRATRTPQRISIGANVPDGRYEAQFFATSAFSTSDRVVSTVQWAGLRGYLTGFTTPANCTLLAMKIRANEQLSQASASQVKVTAERYLPVWDADNAEWVEEKTRSIAWAAADILRNTDYSIGVPDTQYDLAELLRLDGVWAGREDTFNALFDRSWSVYDAVSAVLRAGRAQVVRVGGKIGFVRLETKQIKRAVFTSENVVRGSFSHELIMFNEEKPDCVVAKYFDETVWDDREVTASLAAIGSDQPAKIEYFGITNHDQAWREAVTEAAINAFQREIVGFTAEWEGKLLVRGDPILVDHPFIEAIQTVSLKEIDGQNLAIDRGVRGYPERDPSDAGTDVWDDYDSWNDLEEWSATPPDLYVIVRDKTGEEWGPCLVDSIVGRTVTLNAADRSSVEATMGALSGLLPDDTAEPATVIICTGTARPFNGLVVSARPNGASRVDVIAVIDAPEVYLADGEEVMPSPWQPPTLPPAIPLRPVILGLFAQLKPAAAAMELDAMWQPSPGALRYLAEVSYDEGESWVSIYEGETNRFTATVLPQVLWLRVSAIGSLQGPWAIRQFADGEVPTIIIPSSWIDVDLTNVARDVAGQLGLRPRQIIEQFKQLGTLLEEVDRENYTKREALFREISVELEGLEASFTEIIEVALGPGGAIAVALESLYAAMGGNSSQVNIRWEAVAAPSGYAARYAIQAAVDDGTFRSATFFLDVPADPNQPTRIGLMAGQTVFFTPDGIPIVAIDADGRQRSANGVSEIDWINGGWSFGVPT